MKRVTWLELFFDLVFVVAVTSTATLLGLEHSWLGVARACTVFVPVFWVWVGTTMHANLHEVDTVRGRLGVFTVALCGLMLSLAVPGAFAGTAVLFGAAYWGARIVLYVTVVGQPHRYAFATFTVGAFLTGPLFLGGAFLPVGPRTILWAVAAATDLSVPFLVRRRLAEVPFDADHLAERFGTFVLIALGETVVSTAEGAAHHVEPLKLAAVGSAFVVCCGLWWVYFAQAARAIHHALEAATARIEIIRPVLSYGHLAFIAGIVGVAVGLGAAVEEPMAPLHQDVAAILYGGAAVYLGTFGFTRWRMFRSVSVPRLATAAICLGAIPMAAMMPAIASVIALGLLLVALAVVEPRVVARVPSRTA